MFVQLFQSVHAMVMIYFYGNIVDYLLSVYFNLFHLSDKTCGVIDLNIGQFLANCEISIFML